MEQHGGSSDDSGGWRILDAALDAVVSIDENGEVHRWNSAAERIFGWTRDEVIGRPLRDLIVPHRDRARHARGIQRYLATGQARLLGERIEIQALHRDGHELTVELSIMDLPPGGPDRFTAFIRDLSQERRTEAALARAVRDRSALAESVAGLQTGATADETADAIAAAVRAALKADVVAIRLFGPDQSLTTLGSSTVDGLVTPIMRAASRQRAAYLLERTAAGPWAEVPSDPGRHRVEGEFGPPCVAFAPIRTNNGIVVAALVAASMAPADAERVTGWLPMLTDFAGVARALLLPQLLEGRAVADDRHLVERIISGRDFRQVFQPVVDMESDADVGYEALTRFASGPPDTVFARATAAGIGTELERACLRASVEAGVDLPVTSWLSLNVSPKLLLDVESLGKLIQRSRRTLIFELTEQMPISDYAAIRSAMERLGPSAQLAIDDAGAGFASLRHIIELQPRMVKLDMALVRGVDEDPVRQAMVAGMVHFAERVGCVLVAEGVETHEEARALRDLGLRFAQGYLFSRPVPADELAGRASSTGR